MRYLKSSQSRSSTIAKPAPASPATTDVGGPLVEELVDLATKLAGRRGEPRTVEGYRDDTPRAELLATGALLPGRGARLMGPTFSEWLDAGERLPHLPY